MNKIRSIARLVVFFAVAALLSAPAPSMGQVEIDGVSDYRAEGPVPTIVPIATYMLSDGQSILISLMIPMDTPPFTLNLIDSSGEILGIVDIAGSSTDTDSRTDVGDSYGRRLMLVDVELSYTAAEGLILYANDTQSTVRPPGEPAVVGTYIVLTSPIDMPTWAGPYTCLPTCEEDIVITDTRKEANGQYHSSNTQRITWNIAGKGVQ
jgi:hypothetical protein